MATVIEINGKETVSNAAESAKSAITGMGESSKGIFDNLVVTAGDVVGAIETITSTVGSFFSEYAEQQKALITFNTSIAMADQLTEGAAERLSEYAGVMALKTGADDDAIKSMASFLAVSGRTEEEIQKVISVAADMSIVTGKDLNTSVQELNKSFTGSVGRMAQYIEGIDQLTDAEYASGKAVDIIGEKFKGQVDAMSTSATVAMGNIQNMFDDTKAAIGEAFLPAVQPVLEWLVSFIADPLIPAIQSFAPIVKEVFENVKKFINDVKPAIEPFVVWFSEIWTNTLGPNIESLGVILKNTLTYISSLINGDWRGAWESAKAILQSAIDIISRNFKHITDVIALMVESATNIWEAVISVWKATWDRLQAAVKYRVDAIAAFFAPLTDGVKLVWATVETAWTTVWTKLHDVVKAKIDAIKAFFAPLTDTITFIVGKIDTALSYLPGGKKPGEVGAHANGTDSAEPGLAWVGERGPELVLMRGGEKVIPNHELGSYLNLLSLKGYADGTSLPSIGSSVLDSLGSFISNLATQFGSLFNALGSVNAILNPITTILSALFDVIGPFINTVLAPLVGMLKLIGSTLGQMLAPIISALGPIITSLAIGFVWLYNNAILPFGNLVISIGNFIYNGVVTAINAMLGWLGVHFDTINAEANFLKEISLADLTAVGTTSGNVTSSGGKAAQYSGGAIVNNYVTVYTSALVGTDGIDEFALMIGRSLKAAATLGRS